MPSADPSPDPPSRAGAQSPSSRADYESTPLARSEYVTAVVHLYRGEIYRATVQRTRLDTTTNWAVLTTAGLMAFSFREATNPHWALLVGFVLVSLFLIFEARRYQMFDLWHSRVRKIEENFYGPILRRDPVSPRGDWGERTANDLVLPSYKMSFLVALRARLMRNYWGIYAVLLFGWVLKILIYPDEAHSWSVVKDNMSFGMVPWWMPVVYIGVFLGVLTAVAVFVPSSPPADSPNEAFWGEGPTGPGGRHANV